MANLCVNFAVMLTGGYTMPIRPLMVCLLVGLCSTAFAQANLLVNPGFEAGDEEPSAWNFNYRNSGGLIEWDNARAATGEHSVRLTNAEGETGNVVQSVQIDPPLPPGSTIEFGAMSAADNVAGTNPQIVVYLQPPTGDRKTAVAHGVGGTHDFTEVSGISIADRQIGSVVVYLCHYGTGSAWWDDAWVRVDRAAATTVLPRPEAERDLPPLKTGDGLSLTLNDAGGVSEVRADGFGLQQPGHHSGLWVQPWQGDAVPVAGEVVARDGEVLQKWEDTERGLGVACSWTVDGESLRCEGDVVDLTGEARGVELIASLPVGAEGWRWAESVIREVPLETAVLNDLTFSAVSGPDAGLSLAVPADRPSDCDFGWSAEMGYYVRYRFGLSPEASGALESRAPFAFTIRRIDPDWGLRDAARGYQAANPEAFVKRAEREGLWMFGQPRIELPDPENYTFHEGGPKGWEYDDEHGIYTCPYIIPGQREITRLEELPGSAAEALELFRDWTPDTDDHRASRGWANKEVIENCMLHNREGDPQVVIRDTNWGGKSITFPLNANPWLFADTDRETIGRTLLDYVAAQHDEIPELDGTYVDSLGLWGDFDNYRAEHFSAERVPLSHDIVSGRPMVPNRFTLLEFLYELGDLLHSRDKLLFANGVHPDRRFHALTLDILGVEGHGHLEQKRTMAGSKPFLLLIYRIEDDPQEMEYWFNRCTAWGIWPSFGNMRVFDTPEKYAPVHELNDRYVPSLRAITAAGWQPVTHARAPEGVVIERWGPGEDGSLYLTLFSEEAIEAEVAVDTAALGLAGEVFLRDLLSDEQFVCAAGRLTVPLEAQRVRVLQVQEG
jgi:hypothetical protein